jgi:thymidylate synthase (FAD)
LKIIKPQAELINESPNLIKTIAMAAKLTHSETVDFEMTGPEAERLTRKMIELGHTSTLEHILFTFIIKCSRVCSHQIVRHRIGCSYSQRSERYVEQDNMEVVIPPEIEKSEPQKEVFLDHFRRAQELYEGYRTLAVKKEDARFVLPRVGTQIMMSINGRAIRHFINLRDDPAAQWEIQEIAKQMKEQIPEVLTYDL